MQVKTGISPNTTCAVTNGSPTVTAAAGSDWSQVGPTSQFTVPGSFVIYFVSTCALVGGVWTITLTVNYSGTTNAAQSYVIQKDFDANGAPIFAAGDTEILALLNRWLATVAFTIAPVVGIGFVAPVASGSVALTNGQTTAVLTIPSQSLVGGVYVYRVVAVFENIVDSSPTVINYIVTAKGATSCTVSFNPRPSNANTVMRWLVFQQ